MSPKSVPEVLLRNAVPEDAPACGQICYEAFDSISRGSCAFRAISQRRRLLSARFR